MLSRTTRSQTGVALAGKSFECRDGGVVCRTRITGATEAEVLEKAVEHARKAHGVDLSRSKTLAGDARSLIRDG